MNIKATLNNHYIPCFWSAFWNRDYLNDFRKNKKNIKPARRTKLLTINPKTKKPYLTNSENLFFYKGAYLSKIQTKYELDLLENTFSKLEKDFSEFNENEIYIFDFENSFTAYENIFKPFLLKVIKKGVVENLEDKIFLSLFVYVQMVRIPNNFNLIEELFEFSKVSKSYFFIQIHRSLTNNEILYMILEKFFSKRWKLFQSKDHSFPISDSPFIKIENSIFLCLCPDLILEIDLKCKTEIVENHHILNDNLRARIKNELIKNYKENIVFTDSIFF